VSKILDSFIFCSNKATIKQDLRFFTVVLPRI